MIERLLSMSSLSFDEFFQPVSYDYVTTIPLLGIYSLSPPISLRPGRLMQ
jgi:hypothetical protein